MTWRSKSPWLGRAPWTWPQACQRAVWCLAVCAGAALTSPWVVQALTTADETQQRMLAHEKHLAETRMLQQHTARLTQDRASAISMDTGQPAPSLAPPAWRSLLDAAHALNLQTSALRVEAAVPASSTTPRAEGVGQMSLALHVQGPWSGWMAWVERWPIVAPGAQLVRLQLQGAPRSDWSADLVLWLPQPLADADASWVTAEFQRPRQPLEAWPRERLRYVGHILHDGEVHALVHASDSVAHPIYRVAVGDHLGQDLGRVQAIASEHVQVRELWRDESGLWLARDVVLPLQEVP